jgi:hypothetical protein
MTTYHVRGTLVIGAFDPFDSEIEPETKLIDQHIRAESPEAALTAIAHQSAWPGQPDLTSWLTPPRIDLIGS